MVKIVEHVYTNENQPGEPTLQIMSGKWETMAQAGDPDQVTKQTDDDRQTIFVGDIPVSTDENQLKAVFAKYGFIKAAHIKHEKISKKHLGYGFITFSSRSEASAAFDQKEIGGHEIRVGWARKNQTLVISNPGAAGGLDEILARAGCNADVQSTHINEGGQCTIRFQSRQAAEQFRKKVNGMVASEGCDPCRISWSNTNFNNVHIHFGKDHLVTVQELLTAFSKFGPVEKIVLPQTESGESKGFGFVYYSYGEKGERSAAEAIQAMNGATLRDGTVPIVCNYGHRARTRSCPSRSARGRALNQIERVNAFEAGNLASGSLYSNYPYFDTQNQVLVIPASYYSMMQMYQTGLAPGLHSSLHKADVKFAGTDGLPGNSGNEGQ